jgi:hypothetical protein
MSEVFKRVIRITVAYLGREIDHDGEVAVPLRGYGENEHLYAPPNEELVFYLTRDVVDLRTIRKYVTEFDQRHAFVDQNGEWHPGVAVTSSVGTVLLDQSEETSDD